VGTVLLAFAALLGLVLAPVVVRRLRRKKWVEPPPRLVETSAFADELADRGLADLELRDAQFPVEHRRPT